MKKIHTIFILLITFSFLFSSCKDDPVTIIPPPPPPTNDDKYIWEMKIVHGYLRGTYAADTANVYVNKFFNLLKFNGDTLIDVPLNDPGFEIYGIDGFDRDNVFIGGGYNISGSNPILKKIQNGSIISYPITADNGRQIYDVLCLGNNEAWVSTVWSNYVYRFYSGNFEKYLLNDSVYISYFFRDIIGTLYAFGTKTSVFNSEIFSRVLYSYQFTNNNFNLIRTDTIYSSYTGSHKSNFLNRCGTDLMMTASNEYPVVRFNGNNWENYLANPPEQSFILTHIGGNSKDTLVMFCSNYGKMYIWNSNWNNEDSFLAHIPLYGGIDLYGATGPPIIIKEPNIYFTVSAPLSSVSYFIIGRRNRANDKEAYRLTK